MSLHDDFGMYFGNTYIGVRQSNGKVYPMWVESVQNDSDLFNLRSIPSSQRAAAEHGDEAYNALVFYGNVFNGRSRNHREVGMASDTLVFDLPDPKYIKVGDAYHWASYRANRSTKKGLSDRRFSCSVRLTEQIAMAMFNDVEDENIIGGIFLRNGNKLDYKGVPVGDVDGVNVVLYAEAAHLARVLTAEWPECQITVEEVTA